MTTCTAAVNQRGEHIACDTPYPHDGQPHSNREHEMIWTAVHTPPRAVVELLARIIGDVHAAHAQVTMSEQLRRTMKMHALRDEIRQTGASVTSIGRAARELLKITNPGAVDVVRHANCVTPDAAQLMDVEP